VNEVLDSLNLIFGLAFKGENAGGSEGVQLPQPEGDSLGLSEEAEEGMTRPHEDSMRYELSDSNS